MSLSLAIQHRGLAIVVQPASRRTDVGELHGSGLLTIVMRATSVLVLVVSAAIIFGSVVLMTYRPGASSNMVNLASEPRHPVTVAMQEGARAEAGKPAPEISLVGSDKQPVKLSELLQYGPVVVVMAKDGCPCTIEAQAFFNQIARAYQGKVTFLGVMDAPAVAVSKYKDDFKVPYPMASEQTMKTYEAYRSPRSVYFTVVGKSGIVKRQFPGYSKSILSDFNQLLADEVGVARASLDLGMAPDKESSGCMFGEKLTQ